MRISWTLKCSYRTVFGMDGLVDPQQLLERFGLVTEEDFAAMVGVTRGTLKNRPYSQLPEFVKVGHRSSSKKHQCESTLE